MMSKLYNEEILIPTGILTVQEFYARNWSVNFLLPNGYEKTEVCYCIGNYYSELFKCYEYKNNVRVGFLFQEPFYKEPFKLYSGNVLRDTSALNLSENTSENPKVIAIDKNLHHIPAITLDTSYPLRNAMGRLVATINYNATLNIIIRVTDSKNLLTYYKENNMFVPEEKLKEIITSLLQQETIQKMFVKAVEVVRQYSEKATLAQLQYEKTVKKQLEEHLKENICKRIENCFEYPWFEIEAYSLKITSPSTEKVILMNGIMNHDMKESEIETPDFEKFLRITNDAEQEASETEWISDTIVFEGWKNLSKNIKGYYYYLSNEKDDSNVWTEEYAPLMHDNETSHNTKQENAISFPCEEQHEIGAVNCLKESFPDVVISANGKTYVHKKYDAQITLVEGIRRIILDQENRHWGEFQLVSLDKYRCFYPGGLLDVRVGKFGWNVYLQGKTVATIRYWKSCKRESRRKNEHDEERCLQLVVAKELPRKCYPLLFAIPILGF